MDEYAKELSRYIHLNPVRAKMVTTPEEYEWSSYLCYIGKKKPPPWLYSDFILGSFGNKVSVAKKDYRHFVNTLVDAKYDSPLDEVISSTLLGSPGFISFIKDNFLSDKKSDKDLPALKELINKPSMKDIVDEVESVLGEQPVLARSVKMFLCQRNTHEKLKDIGIHFGIGESAVSHAGRRINDRIRNDRKLKRKIEKIEQNIHKSRFKT